MADTARRWWPLAAAIALGVLVGLLVSLLQSGTRRAQASVLISSPAGAPALRPILPNLRELATSGVVAGNVRSTLRLTESTERLRRRLHATVRPGSDVIAISATDDVADHARQLAQEAANVFAQLVQARFGAGSPEFHAAVLDSAHVLSGPDRHYGRNLLIGGLVGLLLGSAALFVLASRAPRRVVTGDDSEVGKREQLLDQRVSGVSARERALAKRAGLVAAKEQGLEAKEQVLAAREQALAALEQALAEPSSPAPPPTLPPPRGELREGPEAAIPAPAAGAWNLHDLQRAFDAHTDASPEKAEEWRSYLFFLREHALPDGSLPRSFDGLLSEVFGELEEPRTDSST